MGEKSYPNITAVNEQDEVIGYFQLFDAIAKGYSRRISAIFVLDEQERILIQRRAANVLSPNLLDFSAAGHVNEGDDYVSTARAELSEELGIQGVELVQLAPPFKTPGFYNAVFKVCVSSSIVFNTNADEVAKVIWVPFEELISMIEQHPQQFSEPFLAAWPFIRDKISL